MASALRALRLQGSSFTFEVEVVAQHATELPVPAGARALFVLKRRHRLCVTESEAVDGAGGVEWNTRCTQTATLFKQGDGWRPKEFGVKVQVVRDSSRLGQQESRTVAKASLDFSQFCQPEPFGPKQLVIPLQPSGLLHVSIRTQWLQNFNRDTDSLTDISYLSLGQSVLTSVAGPLTTTDEQDLSGFDGSTAVAAAHGSIRAAWQPQPAVDGGGRGATDAAPALKKRSSMASVLRLPRRGVSSKEQQGAQPAAEFEFAAAPAAGGAPLHRSATVPCLSAGSAGATPCSGDSAGGTAARRRPTGASMLHIPDTGCESQAGASGNACEAATPTFWGRDGAGKHPAQQQEQQHAAMGLPPEAWSPIDLQAAVDHLYDSDEEPTPKPTTWGTVKRIFNGQARNITPPLPNTAVRQLHTTFNTPRPTPPKCDLDPCEVAAVDRECSVSALRIRCKHLMAERDEARAEGYAEAALAVEQSVEIDKLRRAKLMLLQRLATTEEQLLACFRDEAASDLIQALAAARVEAAQREFSLLELQGELSKKEGVVTKLRAQLTRTETKHRISVHSLTPGKGPRPEASPWSEAPAPPLTDGPSSAAVQQ